MSASLPLPFRRLSTQLVLANVGLNLAGAILTYIYLIVIDPVPTDTVFLRAFTPQAALTFGGIMLFIFGVAFALDAWNMRYLRQWYPRLRRGEREGVPFKVYRHALSYVARSTVLSFGMWVLAGALFGFGVFQSLRAAFSIILSGGVITTILFFLVFETIWRQALPVFFPEGRLSVVPGGFRLRVPARLLITFALLGLYPAGLLVVLSLGRAEALLTAANPRAVLANLFALEIFILVVTGVVSVTLAIFVSRAIVEPLHRLQEAMVRVEWNQLDSQVLVTSNDEFGYVSERFNAMVARLREGEKLRMLLDLYVSPEVAQEAVRRGAHLGGELVECSVLFADLRDFTGLAESLPPRALIDILNRFMGAMEKAIAAQGGMVNKLGGDSLLAVFGTPLNPTPDHPARAIRAALGMRRALVRFNQEQLQTGLPEMQFGIGIATGPVVAGNVGGTARIEYTVIGDTVNLAARLQGLAKDLKHEILISAPAYTAALRYMALHAEMIPAVTVRGKKEAQDVYVVREP